MEPGSLARITWPIQAEGAPWRLFQALQSCFEEELVQRTSPKRYSCSPHAPTAFMMEVLWITLTEIPSSLALSWKSLCVVALHHTLMGKAVTAGCRQHPPADSGRSRRGTASLQVLFNIRGWHTQRDRPPPGMPRQSCRLPPASCLIAAASGLCQQKAALSERQLSVARSLQNSSGRGRDCSHGKRLWIAKAYRFHHLAVRHDHADAIKLLLHKATAVVSSRSAALQAGRR